MSVWHVTPDYVVNNWTDELLNLMVEKFIQRNQRQTGDNKVSDELLFKMTDKIKRVK